MPITKSAIISLIIAGIVSSEGPFWREQRKFVHSIFRDFGVGTTVFEDKIGEEISYFTKCGIL